MIDLKSGRITGIEDVERNAKPSDIDDPFTDIPDDANRSVSQNLWILVRNDMAGPKVFVCPESPDSSVDDPLKESNGKVRSPKYFVNFMLSSYSFVQPWSVYEDGKTSAQFFWSKDIDSGVVVGADANDGDQPEYPSSSLPPSDPILQRHINSRNHKGNGQNVIYGDGHVAFEKSPYVGIDQDNIYTAQPKEYNGQAGQTAGILTVRPKDQHDSVLIPNREADLKAWDRKP